MQVSRLEDGTRRMTSLQEVNGMEGDIITMSELFTFERQGLDESNRVRGHLRATGVIPAFFKSLSPRGLELPIEIFDPDSSSEGRRHV
jgi:pilus assembly protein CpaF